MTTYHGYVSRAAYLEALRQESLEEAERREQVGAFKDAIEFRDMAVRLMEQILETNRRPAAGGGTNGT